MARLIQSCEGSPITARELKGYLSSLREDDLDLPLLCSVKDGDTRTVNEVDVEGCELGAFLAIYLNDEGKL